MLQRAFDLFRAADRAYYRAEKAAVAASLLLMSTVVFLDVVHRTGGAPRGWAATTGVALFFLAVFYGAARTAKSERPPSRARALAVAAALVAGLYLGVRIFLWLMPSGLIWAQTLALVLTLWVGFLGASMAAHEAKHLKVDAAEKLVPPRARRYVDALAGVVTSAACLALCALGAIYCADWYEQWKDGGGAFEGFPLPKWIAFLVLPLSFGTMGLRFLIFAAARAAGLSGLPGGSPLPHPAPPPSAERGAS